MYDLFLTIAEITLAMTPILLIALLFSRLSRRWSAGCRYAIWCVLLLRLAIPLNFSLPVPAIDLPSPAPAEPMPQFAVAAVPEGYVPTPVSIDPDLLQTAYIADGIPDTAYVDVTATLPTVDVSLDPAVVLCWMWAIGAAVVLAYQAVNCLSSAARLRRWKLPAADERLLAALERAKAAVGLRRGVSLWLCPIVISPMLRGLIRPEILLPHGDYTDDQLDAILRHELIHCRRGDLWWKLCSMLAACLHFFNPLVWIAQKQQEIEMEQSCDDAVFRLGDVSRQAYGETMLAVAREGLSAHAAGLNTQFHASAKTLKARFANILDTSAKRAGVWLIVLALLVAVVCGGLVSCREDAPLDTDENAVIEAAMAAADEAWDFDVAYVTFDGDTATISALHTPAPSYSKQTLTPVWADLTLTSADGNWTVTDGLDGKLNIRSIEAENGRRNAREIKRTAEIEAMIRAVWPGEDSLADYEAANNIYHTAQANLAALSDSGSSLGEMKATLNDLLAQQAASNDSSMELKRRIYSLQDEIDERTQTIAALQDEIKILHSTMQNALPAALRNAAYPLPGPAPQITLDVPAKNAEPALELAAAPGLPVLTVADGIVLAAGYDPVDGNFVLIDHGEGGFTRYCWLSSVSVSEGDAVQRSHQIGLTGRSGHARMAGLRFVFSLGAHADDPQMLYFAANGTLTVPNETTAETTDTATTIAPVVTTAPVVTERPFSLVMPLLDGTYRVGIGFGEYDYYGTKHFNDQARYPAAQDTPVFAAADGVVSAAGYDWQLGNYVTIDHGSGYATTYAHMNAISVGIAHGKPVSQGTQLGVVGTTGNSTGNHLGLMLTKDGDYIDPAPYIHFSLRPAYTYTLSSALPKLHSWTQMTDLHLSNDTVSRLGSEYTAIDYVLRQLYGDNHKFGQYTLRPEQIVIDGKTMDSVWELQYSSYESVLIAMEAGGGHMYLAEAVAPYRATAAVWYPIINGNFGSSLGKTDYTASAVENAAPLFTEQVWFVRNEQYEVKLTGAATVKVEVPVVYEAIVDPSIPPCTADVPLDGLLTRTNKIRIAAEYETAVGYLTRKYGEAHGYTTLTLSTDTFETYDSVWLAKKPDDSSVVIAMKPGGDSYLIGGPQSLTTGWFAAPRFSDSEPYGDAKLTPSKADSLLPRPITFPLD